MCISVSELDHSHNQEMLDILEKSPMISSGLELHFDKSPDIFATTRLWSEDFKYFGVFVNDSLAGFGMYLTYTGYINHKPEKILYIGNFCIDPIHRKKGLLHRLGAYINHNVPHDCHAVFCMILQGNKRAERYFTPGSNLLSFLPITRTMLPYVTRSILILRPKKIPFDHLVRRASKSDIPEIDKFLRKVEKPEFLMPVANYDSMEKRLSMRTGLDIEDYFLAHKNGEMIGLCAAWDVSTFKRTRIIRYKGTMKIIRFIYKLLSRIFNYPDLPARGGAIKELYISDVLIVNDDVAVFRSLITGIYNTYQKKRYNLINVGSYKGDPLLNATKSFFSTSLNSNIYYSSLKGQELNLSDPNYSKPYVDIALI